MSKKDAINIIKSECYVFNPLNFDRSTMINTALDMAVKALEQAIEADKYSVTLDELETYKHQTQFLQNQIKEKRKVKNYEGIPIRNI